MQRTHFSRGTINLFNNWKEQQLEEIKRTLYDLGFVPEAVDAHVESSRMLMDTAYQFGVAYNAEED